LPGVVFPPAHRLAPGGAGATVARRDRQRERHARRALEGPGREVDVEGSVALALQALTDQRAAALRREEDRLGRAASRAGRALDAALRRHPADPAGGRVEVHEERRVDAPRRKPEVEGDEASILAQAVGDVADGLHRGRERLARTLAVPDPDDPLRDLLGFDGSLETDLLPLDHRLAAPAPHGSVGREATRGLLAESHLDEANGHLPAEREAVAFHLHP